MIVVMDADRCGLLHGDSSQLGTVLAPNSVDALVTDPPAGISFMGKEWDDDKGGRDGWIKWLAGILRVAYVALKPGAYGLVWAIPRTSHWTATACENAGFEIRDVVMHLFGTGFPKSLDIAKAIDAHHGATREVVGVDEARAAKLGANQLGDNGYVTPNGWRASNRCADITEAATDDAAKWEGWGTSLKPAAEHWILIRKPLEGTYAENILEHGVGGLNIGGCRIDGVPRDPGFVRPSGRADDWGMQRTGLVGRDTPTGRWPANVTLDEDAAAVLDEQSGALTSGGYPPAGGQRSQGFATGKPNARGTQKFKASTGGASRFFYVAKGSRSEKDEGLDHLPVKSGGEATDREDGSAGLNNPRAGAGRTGGARNHHPTVKSIALMRWLVRLITPPGGTVLDPFAGSGTTGIAALAEGCSFIGVEREADYLPIIEGRLRHALKKYAQNGNNAPSDGV